MALLSNSQIQELAGDINQDGCVSSSDLSLLLQNFGVCLVDNDTTYISDAPLDIIPQVNWIYLDVYTTSPALEVHHMINSSNINAPLYEDIQDSVTTIWAINNQMIQEGPELDIGLALDSGVICDGVFPLTVLLEYQGYYYLREYNAQVNFALETAVDPCNFSNELGFPLTVTTFKEAYYMFEEYEFCINCQ